MANLPPSRALVRPALLLSLLALACNPPPPSTTPDLPQVTVLVAQPNAVGTTFKLSISVSGCDQVQRLELLDNNETIKQVAYSGNPTTVELAPGDFKPNRGIALTLSLTATVTCADGRSNVSQAQSATFFPVEEAIEPESSDAQVVTDYFVADGSGASAAFIGCGREGNISYLYRVPRSNPTNYQKLEMPIPCDASTTITDRKPAGSTGSRWVWTLHQGAFALSTSFKITGTVNKSVDFVTVAPDGNAFLGQDKGLELVNPKAESLWALGALELPGELLGEPLLRPGTTPTVVVPVWTQPESDTTLVKVGVLSYENGDTLSTDDIARISPSQTPTVAFDDAGTVLYVALQGNGSANVKACAIGKASLCQAGTDTQLWISEDLPGTMAALVPYNNGTRLAAIAANQSWFLDVKSGLTSGRALLNKDHLPISPSGTLVARFPLPGLANSGNFYVFNSARPSDSTPLPYPSEIIATDAAEKGELYRYQAPSGSLYGALDDSGALWLRIGPRLVKPYAPAWYRERR